jgi:hypothetical protein
MGLMNHLIQAGARADIARLQIDPENVAFHANPAALRHAAVRRILGAGPADDGYRAFRWTASLSGLSPAFM